MGRNGDDCIKKNADLGYEYLRRLAHFFKEESIKPVPPLIANIAKLLGDDEEEIVISDYCNENSTKFLANIYIGKVFGYYIQLARYADRHFETSKYLSVNEPLINIVERGGMFVLKPRELDIIKVANYPLGSWYERFVEKEPIDID